MNSLLRPVDFGLFSLMALALLATPTRLQAFGGPPGGPFSNGSYFPNDGTFSAVIRGAAGSNLIGTMQFSTTAGAGFSNQSTTQSSTLDLSQLSVTDSTTTAQTGGAGSTGVSTIFLNGYTYSGNSQGSYNPQNSGMTVTFQASAAGMGNGTFSILQRYGNATSGNATSGNITTLTRQQFSYFDSRTINGYADCSTSNAFPNQKFSGNGQLQGQYLEFYGGNSAPAVQPIGPLNISVTGVRLSSTSSNFRTTNVISPYVTTNSILTNP